MLERLFPKADMPVLPVLLEEGDEAEAVNLVPPVPLLLFNGGGGIGTGWSTNVLPRHPVHVCGVQRMMIEALKSKIPSLGFAGTVDNVRDGSVSVAAFEWSDLLPGALGEFDAREPSEAWEHAADGLEPYFHNFAGRVGRDGAKVVTWGRASAWKQGARTWIGISELPI